MMTTLRRCFLLTISALAFAPNSTPAADTVTGPKEPKILWVLKSTEHFVAAPSVGEKDVFVATVGAFNTGAVHAVQLDPAKGYKERIRWTRSAPQLKLPTVSCPAVADGKIIFGDGMHQNDGGTLHCLSAESGGPLWQLPLPGTLIHLEGSPAIANGRVYMGGGNSGVFCVELDRVILNGKEQDAKLVAAEIEKQRKELFVKYEEEKKIDPDFAVPPSEDKLPKATPKIAWHVGQEKWHVDAAVAVAGDKVFAASAYLDKERQGERALLCLNATDGSVKWKSPLKHNPWSGPVVGGKTVLVGESSVRLDPEQLQGAKGEIVAIDVDNGTVRWHKDIPGGIVSAGVANERVAIFTATDGKVRCIKLSDGNDAWAVDVGAPLFAGAALSSDTVYVGDLKGRVHAISLSEGKKLWTLDLLADPAKIGGMIYGTPTIRNGRLYVATCSVVESGGERRPNAVVCIGEK